MLRFKVSVNYTNYIFTNHHSAMTFALMAQEAHEKAPDVEVAIYIENEEEEESKMAISILPQESDVAQDDIEF